MAFFDPKEDVMDVELTQHGKYLLSKGKLKPMYYAFFDEGVIYDSEAASLTESKNDAGERIQDETPSLKTQYSFTGKESFLFDETDDELERASAAEYARMQSMAYPLGTTSLGTDKVPFFNMTMLEGEISSSTPSKLGQERSVNIPSLTAGEKTYAHETMRIPQIAMNVNYNIALVDIEDPDVSFEIDTTISSQSPTVDGLSVAVGTEEIMLILEEGNTSCANENFDIEIFEITSETGPFGEEVLKPLSFKKKLKMVQGNILLDEDEARREIGAETELNPSCVEYFLDVKTDKEIPSSAICSSVSKIKSRGESIYSPCGIDLGCEDLSDVIVTDIYSSTSEEENCN